MTYGSGMQTSVFNFQIGKSVQFQRKKGVFQEKSPENIYSSGK
jgi:hypothetical protein